jgi:hypothetical protein
VGALPHDGKLPTVEEIVEESIDHQLDRWKLRVKQQPDRSWTLHALELAKIFEAGTEKSRTQLYCPELYERFAGDSELQELNRVLIRRRFEQDRDSIDGMVHNKIQLDMMLHLNVPVTDMLAGMEDGTRRRRVRDQTEQPLREAFAKYRSTLGDKHPQTLVALQDLIKLRRQIALKNTDNALQNALQDLIGTIRTEE